MIADFRRNVLDCDIPSDHILLGKVITDLRSEYFKFQRHVREQRSKNAERRDRDSMYRKPNYENPRKDMTRITSKRVKQLENLGFKWREIEPKVRAAKNNASDDAMSSDSESEDEVEFATEVPRKAKRPFVIDVDNESNDGIEILDDSDDDNDGESSASSSSSLSSTSDDYVDLRNTWKNDHANDNEFLVASSIEDISLAATTTVNKELIQAKGATLPIQLYRLLRLSTFHPKLNLCKMIRWTIDGNGFCIVNEEQFLSKIVCKTSKMTKSISFRNTLGQFNFNCVKQGEKHRVTHRVYQHKSITEAKKVNDPSLRLFYRGAPLEGFWSIKTRRDEHENGHSEEELRKTATAKDISAKRHSSRRHSRTRANERDWKDDEASSGSDGSDSPGEDEKPKYFASSREAERERRRTSDGCLLPKDGAEQLLSEDGTYDKPRGAHPNGLIWDKFRGLWAPPHRLTKDPAFKRRRINRVMLPPSTNILTSKQNGESNHGSRGSERRTGDGCLLPKSEPFRLPDGTYKQPKGHVPKKMRWDEIRGLWAPINGTKKRKFGIDTSSSSEESMIIKASKAKLIQHSSSMLRNYLQPKKQKKRHDGTYLNKTFYARTKSNPSGIVRHTINMSNWRKIEKLMQRSRKRRAMAVPIAAPITPTVLNSAMVDEGEVRLI